MRDHLRLSDKVMDCYPCDPKLDSCQDLYQSLVIDVKFAPVIQKSLTLHGLCPSRLLDNAQH